MQRSFTGQIFTEQIDTGQAAVDIEFTREGVSAMTAQGQFFEIPYSQCALRIGGVGRRIVFCRHDERLFTICCKESDFSQALSEGSFGLLDAQLEWQLKNGFRRPIENHFLGINLIAAITMLVLGAYLFARI
jgi:hypothetical protein